MMPVSANAVAVVSDALIGFLIVIGVMVLLYIAFIIWFMYEMMSINQHTKETAAAVNELTELVRSRIPETDCEGVPEQQSALSIDSEYSIK